MTLSFLSVPHFPTKTDRFLALPTGSVVDRICRVAATGVIIGVVGLKLVALSDTAFIVEVIDLPFLALAVDGRALVKEVIPLGSWRTGGNLALL